MEVKVTGLEGVKSGFKELTKATARNVGRRALEAGAEPIRDKARQLAPKDEHDLEKSIQIGNRANTRASRRFKRENPDVIEKFIGIDGTVDKRVAIYSYEQEFGNNYQQAQPYMRPAWESEKMAALDRTVEVLRQETNKSVARARKKAAKK